jgi:UTP:GlnB (protein PII) uridylyltransferase
MAAVQTAQSIKCTNKCKHLSFQTFDSGMHRIKQTRRSPFFTDVSRIGGISRRCYRKSNQCIVRAVAEPIPHITEVEIQIDNDESLEFTAVTVTGPNRPGLLTALSSCFKDLALDVRKVRPSEYMLVIFNSAEQSDMVLNGHFDV